MNAATDVMGQPASKVTSRRARGVDLRRVAMMAGAALAVVAIASGMRYWISTGRFLESTDDAYVGGDITVIAPKVSGFIEQVLVSDNQHVQAGELLVRLDDRDYRAALERAQAAVAAQQATLANLAATRRLQHSVIDQARAGVRAADAEVQRAQADATRFRELSALSAASVEVYQKAAADYAEALAQAQRSGAAVDAAERELAVIDTRQQQTQAALAEARANVEIARLNLGDTQIRSPIAGEVGNRNARTGAYAAIGTQLISVVPAQGLWVDANFKESQLAHLRPGQSVRIRADVLPGRSFIGHVASLAPATGAQFSVLPAENATGNFTKIVQRVPVRVALEGDAAALGLLRPGLSVSVDVDERVSATRGAARPGVP